MKSLFSICLEFVASNVHLLDSLIDFPDTIGKEIFVTAVKKDQFKNIRTKQVAQDNLKVFCDAYGKDGFLDSLNLSSCHLFVNDAIVECPWILRDLTRLDLSFCGLGDKHEILPHLASLYSLQTLNLRRNTLTDEGIRYLTTPLRFAKKNHRLKYVDLSENDLSLKMLPFMKSFDTLIAIILTNSCFNRKNLSKSKQGFEVGKWSIHDACTCCDSKCQVRSSEGWGKEVFEMWKQEYNLSVQRHNPTPRAGLSCTEDVTATVVNQSTCSSFSSSSAMGTKSFYSKRRVPNKDDCPQKLKRKKEVIPAKIAVVTKNFHCQFNKDCKVKESCYNEEDLSMDISSKNQRNKCFQSSSDGLRSSNSQYQSESEQFSLQNRNTDNIDNKYLIKSGYNKNPCLSMLKNMPATTSSNKFCITTTSSICVKKRKRVTPFHEETDNVEKVHQQSVKKECIDGLLGLYTVDSKDLSETIGNSVVSNDKKSSLFADLDYWK